MLPRRHFLRTGALFASVGIAGCNGLIRDSPDDATSELETASTDRTTSGPSTAQTESAHRTLDIRNFGAKVDGKTDDTEAVQSAVDEAEPEDTVYFPPGQTAVSPREGYGPAIRIDATNGTGLSIRGSGPKSVVTLSGNVRKDKHSWLFGIDGSGDPIKGLELRDLVIDGKRERTPEFTTMGINLYPGGTGHDITIEDVQAQNCSESGFTTYGGYIEFVRCTAINNGRQGFGVSPRVDTKDAEVVLEDVVAVGNDKVGIDHNDGVAVIDGFWTENNGAGGAKVPQRTKESTWRNGTFKANGTMGFRYNGDYEDQKFRPFTIHLDNVVAEDNPWAGFWLSGDVDYDIGTIAAHRNNTKRRQRGNIDVYSLSDLDADTVYSSDAHGTGLFYSSERNSAIANYHHSGNRGGSLSGDHLSNLTVANVSNGSVERLDVPERYEVGAWSRRWSRFQEED